MTQFEVYSSFAPKKIAYSFFINKKFKNHLCETGKAVLAKMSVLNPPLATLCNVAVRF